MSDPQTLDYFERIAKLIENHGALTIFAIISGYINVHLVVQLIRGKIVPYSLYKKAVDEADRLQDTMEKERNAYMEKLLTFMGGLKTNGPKEGRKDANRDTE